MDQSLKAKSRRPVRFHEVMEMMKKIVNNHKGDTVQIKGAKKRKLHHFFHKKDYKHNPLEQLYYSEDVFTKKGCREFLAILKLLQKDGEKKNGTPIHLAEKKVMGKEIMEFESLLYEFEQNPDTLSPYLRDRFVALSFKEDLV